jgi:CDGSH-type Zn-finger protein
MKLCECGYTKDKDALCDGSHRPARMERKKIIEELTKHSFDDAATFVEEIK